MNETLNQMLENYLTASDVQLQKGPNSIAFTMDSPEGKSRTSIYMVLPYLHLIYFDIHAQSLPGEIAENTNFHPLQFNYCIGGRIELLLDDNSYFYLRENDLCISRQTSQGESYFPTKYYHGITLYFDPDFFSEANQSMADIFALDFSRLQDIYFEGKETYIAAASSEIRTILERLWQAYETPSPFYMKLYILELLYRMLDGKNVCEEKVFTFYTGVQVEIAKKAEQILTADLRQRIPMKQIAEQLGVSETSLKNYFRGVYGKNVSDYLRDLRISAAEKLLSETKMPISEIASEVGYTKQGKFAEVFRQRFQMNPLEYRRTKRLKAANWNVKESPG